MLLLFWNGSGGTPVTIEYTEVAAFTVELAKVMPLSVEMAKVMPLSVEMAKVVTMTTYAELEDNS